MSTKSGSMVGTSVTNSRAELLTQVATLFKSIPHRDGCPSKPPVNQGTECRCDIGEKLTTLRMSVTGIISEVTPQ